MSGARRPAWRDGRSTSEVSGGARTIAFEALLQRRRAPHQQSPDETEPRHASNAGADVNAPVVALQRAIALIRNRRRPLSSRDRTLPASARPDPGRAPARLAALLACRA